MQLLNSFSALLLAATTVLAAPRTFDQPSRDRCGYFWPVSAGGSSGTGRAKEIHIDCRAGEFYSVLMTDAYGCKPADHTHGLISVGVSAADDPGTVLAILPATYVAAGSVQTGGFTCPPGGIDITIGLDHIEDASWFGVVLERDG